MTKEWNESSLQQYIDDQTEESLILDYKAAGAFGKTDGKKKEITKDVSAMANSADGIIIYGIREHTDAGKEHLPKALTPINRRDFSKEWLEQVINNIRPRIDEVLIHPVALSSAPDDVAYVVEVPQSTTAHQAMDKRYYKRFNFVSEAMDDYEIRDILNRQTAPDASVEFSFENPRISEHKYLLKVHVTNQGTSVINNFQLEFTFPRIVGCENNSIPQRDNIDWSTNGKSGDYLITYRSKSVLFPNEPREIGHEMNWRYKMDSDTYHNISTYQLGPNNSATRIETAFLEWTLYADNMIPKTGRVPFGKLHEF